MILIVANIFNSSLTISSFEKLYKDSLIASYQVIFADLQRKIEGAVRFGKPLDKFYGIDPMLKELKDKSPEIDNVSVSASDGKILYSLQPNQVGTALDTALNVDFSEKTGEEKKKRRYTDENKPINGRYYILLPIKNQDKEWVGTIAVSFMEKVIQEKMKEMIIENLKILGITSLGAVLVLFFFLIQFIDFNNVIRQKWRLNLILIVILGAAQIIYSFYNVQYFKIRYIDITRGKSDKIAGQLVTDIERLLSKGIQINRLTRIEYHMGEMLSSVAEIESIYISDIQNKVIYLADRKKLDDTIPQEADVTPTDDKDAALYLSNLPLNGKERGEGYLNVKISRQMIQEKINNILLDSFTVVAISFIFITELMIMLFIFIDKTLKHTDVSRPDHRPYQRYAIIRPAAFIFCYAMDMSISFLPLHAEDLYKPFAGLSKEFVMGMPISAEMFLASIAFIIGGNWIDRKGWQHPYFWGIIIAAAGSFLSALARTAPMFILYRGLVGLGYGLAFMSYMGFVYSNSDDRNRTQGLVTMSAGMWSGGICGGAVGGMLAERLGYAPIFTISMFIMILAVVFGFVFMRQNFETGAKAAQTAPGLGMKAVFRFIFSRNIFAMLFLLSLPSAVVFVGTLYYVSPIYLDQLGTTQANIARILMIYGLSMIYLAPFIGRMVDNTPNKKIFLVISGVLGAMALLVFYFMEGIVSVIITISMLSLAASFGNSTQTVYALKQKAAQELGGGRAMSIYRSIERIGWVLGPILLGVVISSGNIARGLYTTGLIFLLITLAFMLMAGSEKTAGPPGS
jgi:MFS family permease